MRSSGAAAGAARTRSRPVIAPIPTTKHSNIVKYRLPILLRIEAPPLSSAAGPEFRTTFYRKMSARLFQSRTERNRPAGYKYSPLLSESPFTFGLPATKLETTLAPLAARRRCGRVRDSADGGARELSPSRR